MFSLKNSVHEHHSMGYIVERMEFLLGHGFVLVRRQSLNEIRIKSCPKSFRILGQDIENYLIHSYL